MIHFFRRDFGAALDEIDHTVALNPYFSSAYWALGLIQEYRGELKNRPPHSSGPFNSPRRSPNACGLGRSYAGRQAKTSRQNSRRASGTGQASLCIPTRMASMNFALGEWRKDMF